MNEVVSRMIGTQALLFLYALCGVIVAKAGIIRQENRRVLVRLLMDVCVPLMVLDAFNRPYTADELTRSLTVMALAAAFCLLSGLLGLLLWRRQPAEKKSVLQYAVMFSNAGMAGLPVVALVFGETGVFYASMYLIPPRVLQWTIGLSLFVKGGGRGAFVRNVLLNPVVVVVYVGVAMMFTGWQIPGVLATAIGNIGGMTGPMSMILLGATLAQMRPEMLTDRRVLAACALRLLVIPLACALLLCRTSVDRLILSVVTTLLAMPVASNTATIAERYGGDTPFASACVGVSTLMSVVTVPFVTWVLQSI